MIKFEWNSAKATANINQHGISFEEAKSVFYDEFAVQFHDSEKSEPKGDRFLMLGLSSESRILIVCDCERDSSNTIRITFARKATSRERKYCAGDSS
ncbi:MAG: BrnT family toxin [Candidatus Thiodiazotropha sp.]